MSERDDSWAGIIWFIAKCILVAVFVFVVFDTLNDYHWWFQDLQRRIAVLEMERQ